MKVEDYSRGREAKVASWGLGQKEGWKVLPDLPRISKSRKNSVSVHVGWCIRFVLSLLSLVLGNCFCSVFLWYHTLHLQRSYTASHCIWTRLSLNGAISVVSFVICVLFAQTMILTIQESYTLSFISCLSRLLYTSILDTVCHTRYHIRLMDTAFFCRSHSCNLDQTSWPFEYPRTLFFPGRTFLSTFGLA